jgi:hypothetical protein
MGDTQEGRMRNRSLLAAGGMLAIVCLQPAHAEPKIGVASATKNQVQGILGGGTRVLSSGSDIFSNELVRTGEGALAQLLFLDETSLSVGPSAEVRLDRFVYNPNRGTGNVVIEASRGAFRFATGSQNPTHYTIKTPLATIGVRGTLFDGRSSPNLVELVLWQGALVGRTIWNESFELSNPGDGVIIHRGRLEKVHWDGSGFANVFSINWPLFGRYQPTDPRLSPSPDMPPQDNPLDLNDQLNAIQLRSLCSGGGGGGLAPRRGAAVSLNCGGID